MARKKTITISRKPSPGAAALEAPAGHLPDPLAATPLATTESRPGGFVARGIYTTAYAMSYGLVFGIVLIGQFIPGGRSFGRGLRDGTGAALGRLAVDPPPAAETTHWVA